MKKYATQNINLGALQKELRRLENKWVAISGENKIVGSGSTYAETVETVRKEDVILFKVPPLDASLAPSA